MSYRLTPDEIERMHEDGYVIRERVFTLEECRQITQDCEELLAEVVAHSKDRNRYHVGSYTFAPDWDTGVTIKWEGDTEVVHGLEPFAHISPKMRAWAEDARFVEPMIEFVGDEQPKLWTEKLNLKRPRIGGVNPLHQDYPYWERPEGERDASRIATGMLFLDDASLENGTLQVLPGSHKVGKHRTRDDKDVFGNLEAQPDLEDGKQVVAVEVPAGSVVYFGAFLLHKSAQNTSDKERRTLLFSYSPRDYITSHEESVLASQQYRTSKAAATQ